MTKPNKVTTPLVSYPIHGAHYGFSATRIEDLRASEFTLVTISADISGSVSSFVDQIADCITEVVRACRHSPRADNLMLRAVAFDDKLDEIHGFKPLAACPSDAYRGRLRAGGTTALYDASHNAVASITRYADKLSDGGIDVNGIVFVITDGMDNASSSDADELRKALETSVRSETLSSMVSVLVGVNVSHPEVSRYLGKLRKDAGFDHYLELNDATETTLAGLADFLSRSIYTQSRALSSGSISSTLSF